MPSGRRQIVEVRVIVSVLVDLTAPTLAEALAAHGLKSRSLADVVSWEIVSNLESVAYVESVVVGHL